MMVKDFFGCGGNYYNFVDKNVPSETTDKADYSVIARSEATWQSSRKHGFLDCFASLAMT